MNSVSKRHYVQVAFPIPISDLFTYIVPEHLQGSVQHGCHVTAFLGRRKLAGIVVGSEPREDLARVRPLHSLVRPEPVFDREMLDLTRKVADYYLCPWGEVLAAAYPAHAQKSWRTTPGAASASPVSQDSGARALSGRMEAELSEYFRPLLRSSREGKGQVFLLHLPDEMRENMYPFLISEILEAGGSVLFLVPEVSTSYSLIELLSQRFGNKKALFHSRLRISERKRIWEQSRQGALKVLVGTRSGVFLPVSNLRLIVIEDEHASPFKQEETPRYNARDVAVMRGGVAGVPVLLASATPSVESVLGVERGELQLLKGTPFPEAKPCVSIVDMRKKENLLEGSEEFSLLLVSRIRSALETGKRALLFLNRRGFSTWVQCQDCGSLEKCPVCELPFVFHSRDRSLLCHHCGRREVAPSSCGKCGGVHFRFGGLGVEKVVASMEKLFPDARVARVDLDSAQNRPEAVKIAKRFADGEIDILVGTVFVTKGLKLGEFSVTGMLHMEGQLNLPDFRSGERAFQLLSQIVSLAQESGAEAIIQTLNPEHHSVVSSRTGDAREFYEPELRQRKELGYPPFSALIAFHVSGPKEPEVMKVVEQIRTYAVDTAQQGPREVQVLGPSPAIPPKLRGRFRWYVSIRGEEREKVAETARELLARLGGKHEVSGVTISIDVDPVGG